MNVILTIAVTLFIFGILIAIHELGHYLVARFFGVGIREYSIGMGPKIWQKQGKYNKFSLRALPIGGYVDMVGESTEDDGSAPEDEGKVPLNTKPVWQRMLIVLAGPFMNIVLGFVVMALIVLFQNPIASTTIAQFGDGSISNKPMVYVTHDSGEFEKGDIIYAIDGNFVTADKGLDAFIKDHGTVGEVVVIRKNSNSLLTDVKGVLLSDLPLAFDKEEGGFYLTADHEKLQKGDIIKVVGEDALDPNAYKGSGEEAVKALIKKYPHKEDLGVLRIYAAFTTPTEEGYTVADLGVLKLKAEDGFIKLAEDYEDMKKNGIILSVNGVAVEENETVEGFRQKFKGGDIRVKYRWYIPVQNPIVIKNVNLADIKLAVSGALKVGDEIEEVGSYSTPVYSDLSYGIFMDGVTPVDIVVNRGGKEITLKNVVFYKGNQQGILYGETDFLVHAEEKTLGTVAYNAVFQPVSSLKMTVDSVLQTFKGKFGIEALSGPVGIGEQIGQVLEQEEGVLEYLLNMLVLISFSLGICNLLPLPVLDGGRFVLYAVEGIRRKPLSPKIENVIMGISWVLVMGLMVFVMFKDVINLF